MMLAVSLLCIIISRTLASSPSLSVRTLAVDAGSEFCRGGSTPSLLSEAACEKRSRNCRELGKPGLVFVEGFGCFTGIPLQQCTGTFTTDDNHLCMEREARCDVSHPGLSLEWTYDSDTKQCTARSLLTMTNVPS